MEFQRELEIISYLALLKEGNNKDKVDCMFCGQSITKKTAKYTHLKHCKKITNGESTFIVANRANPNKRVENPNAPAANVVAKIKFIVAFGNKTVSGSRQQCFYKCILSDGSSTWIDTKTLLAASQSIYRFALRFKTENPTKQYDLNDPEIMKKVQFGETIEEIESSEEEIDIEQQNESEQESSEDIDETNTNSSETETETEQFQLRFTPSSEQNGSDNEGSENGIDVTAFFEIFNVNLFF